MRKLLAAGAPALAAAMLLAAGTTPSEAAGKGFRAHVHCSMVNIKTNSAEKFVDAYGTANTKPDAWKAAYKEANNKMPKGYRIKHCTKKEIKKA